MVVVFVFLGCLELGCMWICGEGVGGGYDFLKVDYVGAFVLMRGI